MGNYISTTAQLVFPNGRNFDKSLDSDLLQSEKTTALALIIEEAENWVDNQLKGRTATPASHISSECKQVALEYARSLMMRDNPLIHDEDKESRSKAYFDQAENLLKTLRFGASASVPVASSQNTGDGTISVITVDDEWTITEDWVVRCISISEPTFEVIGSRSGVLYNCVVTDGVYPVQSVCEKYDVQRRIEFTITAGDTDFAEEDEFKFTTYAASWNKDFIRSAEIILGA